MSNKCHCSQATFFSSGNNSRHCVLQLDPPARDSNRSGFFTDWTRHLTNSSITADQLGGFVIHTAATRPPSATVLVSGGRLCCGNGTLGGGASVEVGGQNQSVGTDTWWLVGRLHRQSALHHWVMPGEPTARLCAAPQLPRPRSADPAHCAVRAEECAFVSASQL